MRAVGAEGVQTTGATSRETDSGGEEGRGEGGWRGGYGNWQKDAVLSVWGIISVAPGDKGEEVSETPGERMGWGQNDQRHQ